MPTGSVIPCPGRLEIQVEGARVRLMDLYISSCHDSVDDEWVGMCLRFEGKGLTVEIRDDVAFCSVNASAWGWRISYPSGAQFLPDA